MFPLLLLLCGSVARVSCLEGRAVDIAVPMGKTAVLTVGTCFAITPKQCMSHGYHSSFCTVQVYCFNSMIVFLSPLLCIVSLSTAFPGDALSREEKQGRDINNITIIVFEMKLETGVDVHLCLVPATHHPSNNVLLLGRTPVCLF